MATSTEPGTRAPVEQTRTEDARVSPGPGLRVVGLGLGTGVATAALLAWSLSRPALWFDEAASVVATQRSWGGLWHLLHGTDAPLVPYYALVKAGTGLVTQVYPGAAGHPEILFRLPSAVAVIVAATALIVWLARSAPVRVAVGTGVVLLLTVSVSRYGQEARPYAFVLLTAVLSTIAWAWAVRDPRRWPLLVYALAVAAMVASNALSITLVAAHLAAALASEGGRIRTALRTAAGAALGALVVAPFTVLGLLNGGGPGRVPEVEYDLLRRTFVQLFTSDRTPFLGYGYLVALGLIGATRVIDHQYRFIARLALAWAAVPPLVLLPAVIVRPSLLIARYLLFVVPGWAILGGLGIATMMDVVRRLTRLAAGPAWVGTAVATLAVAGLVAGLAVTQQPSMEKIRTAHGHGHGVDPRQALPDLDRWPGVPVIIQTRALGLQLSAYDEAAAHRTRGIAAQWTGRNIWPTVPTDEARGQIYAQLPRVVALLEPDTLVPGCRRAPRGERQRVAWAQRCLPVPLQAAGFQVTAVRVHGTDIVTEVLKK